MSREVALGQDEDARRPMWFKLVKSSIYYRKPAPFSDSIHNSLQVTRLGDPDPADVSDEVFHLST